MTITDFDTYQQETMRTCGVMDTNDQLILAALGLAGEVGEVVEHIKKWRFHAIPFDTDKLVKELGDVLWYLSVCAEALDAPLSEVATANIEKLRKRYPEKFTMGGGVRA